MPRVRSVATEVLVGVVNYYRHNTEPHRWRGWHPFVSHTDLIGLTFVVLLLSEVETWPMLVYLIGSGFLFFASMHYHWCNQSEFWRKIDHFGIWLFISVSPLPFISRPDVVIWLIAVMILVGYVIKFHYPLERSVSNWCFMALALTLLVSFGTDPLLGEALKWSDTTWLFVAGLVCFLIQFWLFHKEVPGRHYREIQHAFVLTGFYCHATAGLTLQ